MTRLNVAIAAEEAAGAQTVKTVARSDHRVVAVLDSLGFVDLVLHLETRFGVAVDLETVDFDDFRSTKAIARMSKLGYRASP